MDKPCRSPSARACLWVTLKASRPGWEQRDVINFHRLYF